MATTMPEAQHWCAVAAACPARLNDDHTVEAQALEVEGAQVDPGNDNDLERCAQLLNQAQPAGPLLPLRVSAGANPKGFTYLLRIEEQQWSGPREWLIAFG